MTSPSSFWPLPSTPAIAENLALAADRATDRAAPARRGRLWRTRRAATAAPLGHPRVCRRGSRSGGGAPPNIRSTIALFDRASRSAQARFGRAEFAAPCAPRASTVTRSLTRQRLFQFMGDQHHRDTFRAAAQQSRAEPSTSTGVSTDVGSSSSSTREPRESALMISTRCRCPRREMAHFGVGRDVQSEFGQHAVRARAAPWPDRARTGRSAPSTTFSSTDRFGTRVKCW